VAFHADRTWQFASKSSVHTPYPFSTCLHIFTYQTEFDPIKEFSLNLACMCELHEQMLTSCIYIGVFQNEFAKVRRKRIDVGDGEHGGNELWV